MNHPTPEALATFIDGTADAATRAEVTEHIESCDDCLMIVGETARLMDEPVAPLRRSPRYGRWMLVAATVIAVAGGWWWRDRDPLSPLVRASRTLTTRPVQGRLSDFDWLPQNRMRGNESAAQNELNKVRGVASIVIEKNAQAMQDARRQHAAGVGALIAGEPAQAIAALRRATEITPENAAYWNDLAAAYLEAYEAKGEASQLPDALAAADHALRIDETFLPALFNRALILRQLGAREQAADAFKRYLSHDAASAWADDARHDLESMQQQGAAGSWKEDQPRLERAAIAGDDDAVREIVTRHPYEARSFGELIYLTDGVSSPEQLKIARAIATALVRSTGESMLSDAVMAIDMTRDPSARNALIAGHRSYKTARDLYRDRRIQEAEPQFEGAANSLRSAGSPFAAMAEYYIANCLYDLNRSHEALAKLDALLATTLQKYIALRAQLFWERASVLSRDGFADEALKNQVASAELFERLGEPRPANLMRSDAAASYALLGRRSDAWRMRREIMRTTAEPLDRAVALEISARTEALSGRWDTAASLLSAVLEQSQQLGPRVTSSCFVWRALAESRLGVRADAQRSVARAGAVAARVPDPAIRAAALGELTFASGVLETENDATQSLRLLTTYINDAIARKDTIYVAEAFVQRARALRRLNRLDDAERDLVDALRWVAQRQPSSHSSYREAYFATADSARRELIDVRASTGRAALAMFGDAAAKQPWLAFPADKVVAQFVTLPHETIVLMATRNGATQASRMPLGEQELAALVDELVDSIERGEERQQHDVGKRFNQHLPPHLTEALRTANVVIIPDGPLYQMPFAAVFPEGVSLAEAPDVDTAIRASSPHAAKQLTVIAVGNPTIDRATFDLAALPAAESEAHDVAALYASAPICGRDATKTRVKALLPQSDVAEFATHAIASPTDPSSSCLVLAPETGDSGALTAREISALPLQRLRVAILTGCRTAATSQNGGASDSIALAFLRAGAGNVIASLWRIDDDVARTFSLHLHRELRAGVAPAVALQHAQRAMRESSNPALRTARNWSGFIVTGNGN